MFLAFIFCCTSPNAAAKAVADKPCACVVRPQVARSPWAARTRMTRAARRRSWERKRKVSCHLCDLLCSNFFTVHAVSYRCLLTVTLPNAASHKARKTACTSCFTVLLRLGKVRLHRYICRVGPNRIWDFRLRIYIRRINCINSVYLKFRHSQNLILGGSFCSS